MGEIITRIGVSDISTRVLISDILESLPSACLESSFKNNSDYLEMRCIVQVIYSVQ